jgi:hypothetical protein
MIVRKLLLAVLVGLTLVFASLSVIEFALSTNRITQTVNSTLASTKTVLFPVPVPSFLERNGSLLIDGYGLFFYVATDYTAPKTFTFHNITFNSTPEVTTGAPCAFFTVNFHDASVEKLSVCSFTTNYGHEAAMALSMHYDPRVGLYFQSDGTVYVMVNQ